MYYTFLLSLLLSIPTGSLGFVSSYLGACSIPSHHNILISCHPSNTLGSHIIFFTSEVFRAVHYLGDRMQITYLGLSGLPGVDFTLPSSIISYFVLWGTSRMTTGNVSQQIIVSGTYMEVFNFFLFSSFFSFLLLSSCNTSCILVKLVLPLHIIFFPTSTPLVRFHSLYLFIYSVDIY